MQAKPQTKIRRDYFKHLIVETSGVIDLGGRKADLDVMTRKTERGYVLTTATVNWIGEGVSRTHCMFQDFCQAIGALHGVSRATQKVLLNEHGLYVSPERWKSLIQEVKDFYKIVD